MEKTIQRLPETIQKSLKKVTKEQILRLRLTGKRFVVFKFDEQLYAYQPRKAEDARTIKEAFGTHKCSDCANFCKNGRLCPKVEDLSVETTRKYSTSEEEAQRTSKRIEKYPIILKGVEYFNSPRGYLVVEECSKFERNNDKAERDALWKKHADDFFNAKAQEAFRKINSERAIRGSSVWIS